MYKEDVLRMQILAVPLHFVRNRFSIKPLSSRDFIDAFMVLGSPILLSIFD